MALTATKQKFLKDFYRACQKVCPSYNLLAIEGITAQAMNETGYGSTKLSKYNNFWGMKAGSSYKGKTVVMQTWEEVNGKRVTINAKFRAYDTIEDGIKGYCEFIKAYSRYKNLFGVTDNEQYIRYIKQDGWATDSAYVSKVVNILNTYVIPLCGIASVKAEHIPLNYRVGKTYTVQVDALNVRTKKASQDISAIPNGAKIGSKKKGEIIKNQATALVNNSIWMYAGLDSKKREQWLCADNGEKAYIS